MGDSEEKYVPNKIPIESGDPFVTLANILGVIRYNLHWDNDFPQFRVMVKAIRYVDELIKKDIVDLKKNPELTPDKDSIYKIDRIWNGGCCYCFLWDDDGATLRHKILTYGDPEKEFNASLALRKRLFDLERKMIYNEKKMTVIENPTDYGINPFELNIEEVDVVVNNMLDSDEIKKYAESAVNERMKEIRVVKLPKLKKLVPIDGTDSDRWGVRVRDTWKLAYAWEGVPYGDIVNDGKFAYYTTEGVIPKISPEDMGSTKEKTSVFSSDNYQSLMDDYTYYMQEHWAVLSVDYQRLIEYGKSKKQYEAFEGLQTDDDNPYKVTMSDEIEEAERNV